MRTNAQAKHLNQILDSPKEHPRANIFSPFNNFVRLHFLDRGQGSVVTLSSDVQVFARAWSVT